MEDAKNKMAGIMKGTNFFRHIALLIAFVFLTTGLTACIQNHKIYEDGYWQYIVIGKNTFFPQNSDDREVAIVGLTEIGKEQTSLDVPPTIDGMDVTHIGYYKRSWISGGNYRIETKLGLKDKAKEVKAVSGDSTLGYDILSFNENGDEIHIEVKSKSGNISYLDFYISDNEYEKLNANENHFVYYISNVRSQKPKLFKLNGKMLKQECVKPVLFRVSLDYTIQF